MNIIVNKMSEISLKQASQQPPIDEPQRATFEENISYPEMLADQQCADMLAADAVADVAAPSTSKAAAASRPKRACRERAEPVAPRLSHRKVMKKGGGSFKADPSASKLSDITKIYSKQTLSKFRPTNLETVFEEEDNDEQQQQEEGAMQQQHNDLRQQVRMIGLKKLRRTLICKNGFECNKAVLKKRRDKMRRNNLPRHRKISMAKFMDHMMSLGESVERANSGNSELDSWNAAGHDHDDSDTSSADSIDANLMANLQKLANVKPPTA